MNRTTLFALIAATTLAPFAEAGPVQYLSADRYARAQATAQSGAAQDEAESFGLGRFEGDLYAEQTENGDSGSTFSSALHYRSLLLDNRIVTRTESEFGGRDYGLVNRRLRFNSFIEFRLTETTEVSFRLDQIVGEQYFPQDVRVSVFGVSADRYLLNQYIGSSDEKTYWSRTLNPGTFQFMLNISEETSRAGAGDHQWVLQLPTPSSAALLAIGGLVTARRRR